MTKDLAVILGCYVNPLSKKQDDRRHRGGHFNAIQVLQDESLPISPSPSPSPSAYGSIDDTRRFVPIQHYPFEMLRKQS